VVQQALVNIIQPIFEKDFHPSSYGYRPGRSCQQAIAKAERFMNKYALKHVVDMDLSKCFDTLDHEQIIEKVNRKISDGSVLKLIKQFLKAGIMKNGEYAQTLSGSPQGGLCKALHKPPYAKKKIMQSKALKRAKRGQSPLNYFA
jgi:RNA-directed DNA polymerase